MAAAITDGHGKAEFLASKAGVTLGSVQSIVEGGGYINCTGDEESSYAEYEGEQPDFGSPPSSIATSPSVAPESAAAGAAELHRPTSRSTPKQHVVAHKASAATVRR